MSPEAQRVAIAEACGWTLDKKAIANGFPRRAAWRKAGTLGVSELPDYINDLNAMHEAAMWLKKTNTSKYAKCLFQLRKLAHPESEDATAPQRAEAFLKTLNLWSDSK